MLRRMFLITGKPVWKQLTRKKLVSSIVNNVSEFHNVRRIPEPDRILETTQIKSTILYMRQLIDQD